MKKQRKRNAGKELKWVVQMTIQEGRNKLKKGKLNKTTSAKGHVHSVSTG